MPVDRARLLRLAREPYSRDTTAAAQAFLNRVMREMPPVKRASRAFELNQFVRDMAVAAHLKRDPSLTPSEAKRLMIRGVLGDELFARVYGGTGGR